MGLIRVPMYEYLWGHTAAQVELMSCDQPFVAYKRTREETMEEKSKRMDATVEKWRKRREKRKFNIHDFLNGKKQ